MFFCAYSSASFAIRLSIFSPDDGVVDAHEEVRGFLVVRLIEDHVPNGLSGVQFWGVVVFLAPSLDVFDGTELVRAKIPRFADINGVEFMLPVVGMRLPCFQIRLPFVQRLHFRIDQGCSVQRIPCRGVLRAQFGRFAFRVRRGRHFLPR